LQEYTCGLIKNQVKRILGSAVDLSKRITQYFSIKYLDQNKTMRICNALAYYEYSAFSLTILKYINISNLSKKEAYKLILEREQFYFDKFKPEYNINPIAESRLGTLHSEELIAKMNEIQKSINRTGVNNPMFRLTDENHHLFGLSHCIASRAKINEAKETTIFVYDTQSSLVNIFNSANKVAKFFNCFHTTILKNANNNKLFKNKWYLFLNKNFLENTSKGSSDSDK
jgi:group I intron endonuclease